MLVRPSSARLVAITDFFERWLDSVYDGEEPEPPARPSAPRARGVS
jgi:hypothetical protein